MSFSIKHKKSIAASIDPQPAAKHFDIILGLDFHLLLIPPSPAPIPFPVIPFGALVFDPMDYIHITLPAMPAFVNGKFTIQKNVPMGGTVLINGFYRAGATSALMGMPPTVPPIMGKVKAMGSLVKKLTPLHMVVPKTNFYIPFLAPHDGQISHGSNTVKTQGMEQSTLSCFVFSCAHVGRIVLNNPIGFFNNYATAIIGVIPMGKPVLVGGPKVEHKFSVDDLLNSLMFMGIMFAAKAIMKLLGKLMSKIMAAIGKKFPGFAKFRNAVQALICKYIGEPVDPASGHMTSYLQGFSLPGPIPFCWEVNYYSDSNYDGPLGKNMYHSYDISLLINKMEGYVVMSDTAGRPVVFPTLKRGELFFNPIEKLELRRNEDGEYVILNKEGLFYYFNVQKNKEGHQHIRSIVNRNGFAIRFLYERDNLSQIIDSAGRIIDVDVNDQGKITSLKMQHPDNKEIRFAQVRYEYDVHDRLTSFYDAESYSNQFQWQGRYIIARTFEEGTKFTFEFDDQGKCTSALGPNGLYSYRFAYFDNYTEVTNSLGNKSIYFHHNGVVTRIINPQGGQKLFDYDDCYNLVAETDENGITKAWEYDNRGNIIVEILPGKGSTTTVYNDQDKPVVKTLPNGGVWNYVYDESGNLVATINPEKASNKLKYDDGLLVEVVNLYGIATHLKYDKYFNNSRVSFANGTSVSYVFDSLGRCTSIRHPNGKWYYQVFNLRGDLIRTINPDGDIKRMSYNASGDVLSISDSFRQIGYDYDFFGNIVRRTRGGTSIRFSYDTEGQLTAVENEAGDIFRFTLNTEGQIIKETDFEGAERHYTRDAGGRIVLIKKEGGNTIFIDRNNAGQASKIIYSDGEAEMYDYDAMDQMIYAKNSFAEIQFTRDVMGRITREFCNGSTIESKYNLAGRRINLKSSLGADFHILYNQTTGLEEKIMANGWMADIQRNVLGQETRRILPGNVKLDLRYDEAGRLIEQSLYAADSERKTHYQWAGERLNKISDSIKGNRLFRYDAQDNLEEVLYGDGTVEFRIHDVLGNLFETRERTDRKYGKCGQLKNKEGWHYEYDAEGNLIRREHARGDVWIYEWNVAGMLTKVTTPDNNEVSFTYDAFGRRLSKQYKKTITRFVWDGDALLHQWKENTQTGQKLRAVEVAESRFEEFATAENGEVTTWLFEPQSLIPIAKIKGDKKYSVLTDHIGTPNQMLTEGGESFWECELDSFGKIRQQEGAHGSCPFRFQGQYEDAETGLFYNRFRYYDPDLGNYISKDPVGLRGNNPTLYGYVKDPNTWIDLYGLTPCAPKKGRKKTARVESGADAPGGGGIYSFKDNKGNVYTGSTNDFQSRMNDHIASGKLVPPETVTFTPVDPGKGRSDAGARRVRRFMEQKQIGVDANGEPKPNKSTNTRAVSPEKWEEYTDNGIPDFNDPYFD